MTYVPNLLYLNVGVASDGKTANEAWQKNEETVKKLFDVLKTYGINPKDMKTTGLNITPRYVQHKDQEPELIGYTASYDLSVTVRKFDEAGRVMDALVSGGANRHMNIAFGHSDIEQMMDEARTKAAPGRPQEGQPVRHRLRGQPGAGAVDLRGTGLRAQLHRLRTPGGG